MTRRFKKPWSGSALTQGKTRQGKAYARPGAPFLLVSAGKQIGNKQIPFLAVPIAVSSTDDPLREGRKKPARLRLPTQHLSHCSRRVKISEPRSRKWNAQLQYPQRMIALGNAGMSPFLSCLSFITAQPFCTAL